jgi:hypothetical protein
MVNISAKTLFKTGSLSMMIIGIGHTTIHFAVKGKDPAGAHVVAQMEQFKINIGGLGSRNLLEFHEGFSITMGILLFFFGLQNFLIANNLKTYNIKRGIIWIPVLTAAVLLLLSLKYFIIIPQALSFIALVSYGMCLWKNEVKSEK